MPLELLHQHAFVSAVLAEAVAVQRAAGVDPLSDEDSAPTLDELQFYVTRVGYALSHLLTWVEQLHHAVVLLGDFGYSRRLREAGVNRSHHLLFNVENYLVRLQSVYDRLLQLTNAVFHICMSDELVNHGLIVSNLHVARTKVPQLLKVVRRTIQDKADARNDIVHKHSFMDPNLRRIELLYMHTEATWPSDDPKFPYKNLCYVRSQQMKAATAAKRLEFEKINASLLRTLDPLLNELHLQYQRQRVRLGQ